MADTINDTYLEGLAIDQDGIDRRGFLKCMAWAGTGMLFSVNGGILSSHPISNILGGLSGGALEAVKTASFSFVQISDSHIGFSKEANKDVVGTLQLAVDGINRGPRPDLLLHTGDLSHSSKPEEFDVLNQVLRGMNTGDHHFVPGEHDVLVDDGKSYLERFGKGSKGSGWYSFDHKGVHFVALVNVVNLKAGGLGNLGEAQLAWLADDLKPLRSSTPIVVFAHIPLWAVYPEWGWGTDDAGRALELLKRFGSVSVLNGHIHQVMQKVEGNVTFHSAMSTAFPQPKPGQAAGPGPVKVPADQLKALLGITNVNFVRNQGSLAIVDRTLATFSSAEARAAKVNIDNFTFSPNVLTVAKGSEITWTNKDDIPHTVVETSGKFKSKVLDTNDTFSWKSGDSGSFSYFCSIHPHMTGKVIVE